ncbi:hypothetical protein HXX76_002949 [Chlamydomonas incerta]|uniref:Uncharacterized protein n=1 Tax=Chlamydomonas incerta TaxID=51695 RepID=A0A835W7Z0_CHLIN|nr:hypothetical protein HXX76_002949 [Chlamydomonas incerta]|eukprot:KAG2442870.1 hypothetical protein HXX76_002949 [Chlamydomonas incerta]
MEKGVEALGKTLTAAGWGAADLPAGTVRDVLTRPCPSGCAATSAGAAAARADGRSSARRTAARGGSGRAAAGCSSSGGGGGSKGRKGGDNSGRAVEAREFVGWAELPRYAQKAIHNKGRWCWFAGMDEDGGAYGSLRSHLAFDHADVGPELLQRIMVPGGQEQAVYQDTRPAQFWGTSYRHETLVAPDDPRVIEFAEELEGLMDDNLLWTSARKWSDDGAVVFGRNNDVELACPCPGCDVVSLIRMDQAYDSFKVALRADVKAEQMPWGPLREAMVNESGVRGKMCYHGWQNLPRHAQLGFIRAVRWRWFDEQWHSRDPYHDMRQHFLEEHAGDPEADRIKALLLDRKGEELEDAPENATRRKTRELMDELEAQLEAFTKRRRPAEAADGEQAAGGAAGAARGRAAPRGRRR